MDSEWILHGFCMDSGSDYIGWIQGELWVGPRNRMCALPNVLAGSGCAMNGFWVDSESRMYGFALCFDWFWMCWVDSDWVLP